MRQTSTRLPAQAGIPLYNFICKVLNLTQNNHHAENLYNYLNLKIEPQPSNLILLLCSNDLRVAEEAAKLYRQLLAPLILISGGIAHQNDLLNTGWEKPEAEVFMDELIRLGIPQSSLLSEDKATNTGENVTCSYEVIKQKNIKTERIILVQKPYMTRRAYATFKKQWPDEQTVFYTSSPDISYNDYPNEIINREMLINILVGDMQRVIAYPEKGFQIEMEVPDDVMQSYEFLKTSGFTQHLIS